tara:strand:+ start:289 stop:1137 length:849 start_codon:yes stop_codon:yes gene_type:complete
MENKKVIFLYADQGADYLTIEATLKKSLPDFEIRRVKRQDLISKRNFNAKNVAAFILPGAGSNGEYDKRLQYDGMQAIKDYVNEGGLFFGICAGAYYASSRLEWKQGVPDKERTKEPPLKLFNGVAKGPIRKLLQDNSKDWHWDQAIAVPVKVTFKNGEEKEIKALYWGGPHLLSDRPLIENPDNFIKARFSSLIARPPCLIETKVGKGTVILSSIHPEVSKERLMMFTTGNHNRVDEMKEVLSQLEPYEADRQRLWDEFMDLIKENSKPRPSKKNSLRPRV